MRYLTALFIAISIVLSHEVQSQKFLFTSDLGGGRIFTLETNGTNPTILKDFSHGSLPTGNLVLVDDTFWGVTYEGGRYDYGVIFSINKNGTGYEEHYYFDHVNGANPVGELTLIDGKLWGVTENGGNLDYGVIYTVDLSGNFSKVEDVQSIGARKPEGKLVDFHGKVWGVANIGGTNFDGVIFNLNYNGTGLTKIHDFNDTDGANPEGGLVVANNLLWGVTRLGGPSDAGTVFTIDHMESVTTNIYDFDNSDGYIPAGYLVESSGDMWGITQLGGSNDEGVIFSIDISTYGFTKHHDFARGQSFDGNLVAVGENLWGMASEGGDTYRDGTIYKIKNDGSEFQEVHEFNFSNGAYPTAGLINDGNTLYGMTRWGGEGYGVIFGYDIDQSEFFNISNFVNPDGSSTITKPIESCGKLIGTTNTGDNLYGKVYQMNFDGTDFTVLHEFNDEDGDAPKGLLVHEGYIWGFAQSGGENDAGTIFRMNLDGSNFTTVYHFETTTGHGPIGSPLIVNKTLYGTTNVGGSTNRGVIFSFDIETLSYTLLHTFSVAASSAGNLLFHNNKLWGTTISGGNDFQGTLFSYGIDDSSFNLLQEFEHGVTGTRPKGSLTASDGRVWGRAGERVFSIAENGTGFRIDHVLTNDQGPFNESGIIMYNDKMWMGSTMGQDILAGSLLTMDANGSNLSKLSDYSREYGTPSSQTVIYDKMDQVITVDPITKTFNDDPFTLAITSSSSNEIHLRSDNDNVVSIEDGIVTINNAGETSIFIYQEADGIYYSGCLRINVTVDKAPQEITFESIADKIIGDAAFDLNASSSSGLAVYFESSDEEVATISGNTVTIEGEGSCTITAFQDGNENYLAASHIEQSFKVASAPLGYLDVQELKIFPNPFYEEITISGTDIIQVKLFDQTGRQIPLNYKYLSDGVTIESIKNNNGIYILVVETLKGHYSYRIVKRSKN